MAVNWLLYETLLSNGAPTDRRDVVVEESVNAFVSGMTDDPAYQKNAIVDGTETPIIADRKSTKTCKIKASPNTDIHIGDMVECFGESWIVVELYSDKVGIVNGEMWLCNSLLRFQNRSSAVISRHCVIDDGVYSKANSNTDARIMENTYKIYITLDNDTEQMFVDKRLSLGEIYSATGEKILEVYKIIGIDIKSKNYGEGSHLMVITVQRDVYDDHVDSISENICDIYVSNDDESSPQVAGSCVVVGRDTIRIGATRKYVAKFSDSNGADAGEVNPVWDVTLPTGMSYITDGFECTINVPLEENLVGETVVITVSEDSGKYGCYEKKVRVITVG